MEKSIEERIIEAKQDLVSFRTPQNVQADSFKLYRYRSENLAFRHIDGKFEEINFEFIPNGHLKGDFVCMFSVMEGNGSSSFVIDGNDSRKGKAWYYGYYDELADITKNCYITCYSTCEGELKISTELKNI